MSYEVFNGKRRRYGLGLTISIGNNRINLNRAVVDIFKERGIKKVLLLWDREAQKIAIRRASDGDSRAFRVLYETVGKSAVLSSEPFLHFIGYSQHTRVSATWDEKTETLKAKLSEDRLPEATVDQK